MDAAALLQEQMSLPPLREDLALHPGPARGDGAPTWMIEDPLKGRYYRIGWLEFEVLNRWHLGDARRLAGQVAQETLLTPAVEEVLAVRDFFQQHGLLHHPAQVERAARGELPQPGLAKQALHHYLMFRIPLLNPERFLQVGLPLFQPLLGRTALAASALAGVVGLALVVQQWEVFSTTFVETLSLQGLLSYSLALVFAKVLHELGHAFTAKSLGLRVPRMGVALVLLFPMLYTDTGETWRLQRRRDRFAIAVAGMRIEMMLAAWCTLAWSFLPEGTLRSAVFYLGTTSWMVTLAINASPFMRFDGYYMMSDATGIPNLHEASAEQVRHALRRCMLGWADPAPTLDGEDAPAWLVWFGLATMVYRLFLFLGIAVAVYHLFFKALGIFLFAVEIWWFVLRPAVTELGVWWQGRSRISGGARLRLATLLAIPLAVLLTPWQSQIHAEGWIRAGHEYTVYPPRTALVDTLPVPGRVEPGQALARLQVAELTLRDSRATARMDALDAVLQAGVGGEPTRESHRSTREQWMHQKLEQQGADAEARQLQLTAPFGGELIDAVRDLAPGMTVAPREVLGRVIDPSRWVAEVFVDEDQVKRARAGAAVKVYLHAVEGTVLEGQVLAVDSLPVEQLPADMLADKFGGRLLTINDSASLKPRRSLYRLHVTLSHLPHERQARLAAFVIEGQRVSLADSLWRGAISALMLQATF